MKTPGASPPAPELREFIDRVVVPALLERFLREHRDDESRSPARPSDSQIECPPSA